MSRLKVAANVPGLCAVADPCSVSPAVHMTRSDMLNLQFSFLMNGQLLTEADQGPGDQDLHASRPLHKTRSYVYILINL